MRRVLLAQAACLALCGRGAGPTEREALPRTVLPQGALPGRFRAPRSSSPARLAPVSRRRVSGSWSSTGRSACACASGRARARCPCGCGAGGWKRRAAGARRRGPDGRSRRREGQAVRRLHHRPDGRGQRDGGRAHGAGAAGALPWRLRSRLRPRVRAGRSCRGDRLMYCRAGEGILRLREKSEQRRTP
jgi:hypothetical protein